MYGYEYYLENLGEGGYEKLTDWLRAHGCGTLLDDIFFVPVTTLTPMQQKHKETCGPYVTALETIALGFALDMVVLARNTLHCECMGPATDAQVQAILRDVRAILDELGIFAPIVRGKQGKAQA